MKYARDFRQDARTVLSGRWGLAIGAGLLYSILNGGLVTFKTQFDSSDLRSLLSQATSEGNWVENTHSILQGSGNSWNFLDLNALIPNKAVLLYTFLISLAFSFLGACVQLGLYKMNLKYYDPDKTPVIGDLFTYFRIFFKSFGLRFLTGLIVGLWSILFIIPGIIASFRYAMAPYIMAENPEIGIVEALRKSKEIMIGNKWRLFCLQLSFIGWGFLCLFTFGIGFIFLSPYQLMAETGFYLEITKGSRPQTAEAQNENNSLGY